MMKYSHLTFVASLLLITSSTAIAADDTDEINIEVNQRELLSLVGSALSTRSFTVSQMQAGTVNLGNLGVSSNKGNSCAITFSSGKSYNLIHSDNETSLTEYTLGYNGQVFNESNQTSTAFNCKDLNNNLSALILTPTTISQDNSTIKAGTYKDTVTVTVTSS